MTLFIPDNNKAEREYVLNYVFRDTYNIPVSYRYVNSDSYKLSFDHKCITFEDHFWNDYQDKTYLRTSALPTVTYTSNKFCPEKDIPILYGYGLITEGPGYLKCGIDIFAGIFFMLSRWEEYVVGDRDIHNRFPGTSSTAYKNGFLSRPVVNEYIEMLWNMLVYIGYRGERRLSGRTISLTHDIDLIKIPNRITSTLKSAASELIRKKNIKSSISCISSLFQRNPYDTIDFLADNDEKTGSLSTFYIMSSSFRTDRYSRANYLHTDLFREMIRRISNGSHTIGFHPSYFSYDNSEIWTEEKRKLEKAICLDIRESRQHYLRFSVPATISILEKNHIQTDSSLGYADHYGYRCGTGDSFPLFDFLRSRTTEVMESPLVIMDTTLNKYSGNDASAAEKIIFQHLDIAKRYNMKITLLFHNSNFYGEKWKGWKQLYINMIEKIRAEKNPVSS